MKGDWRERAAEHAKADEFFSGLTSGEKWEIGDQLVLGALDCSWWFPEGKRPSPAFLNRLADAVEHWELCGE